MSTTKSAATSGHLHSRPHLPPELEREICEIAAFNFPKCIPNLILVVHRFRTWIEPELYRIILSGDEACLPPLYVGQPEDPHSSSRVLDKARIRVFGPHVRHVLLWMKSPKEVAEILECCPNVSSLSLWMIEGGAMDPLIPILENLPLRKLSINPSDLFQSHSIENTIPFNGPIFVNLTHLEIISSTSSWSRWKQLALLPKLTHLSLYIFDITQEFVDRVLEECRSLELLILLHLSQHLLNALVIPQKDDRVVCLPAVLDFSDDWKEWQKGARGEEDYWIRAQIMKEEAIQARQCDAARRATTEQA